MTRKKFCANLILILIASLFLGGCGDTEIMPENIFTKDVKDRTSMLEEPKIAYEVPRVYPRIVVDLLAYETGRDKKAVLASEAIPAVFDIVNANTGDVVYHGNVKLRDTIEEDDLESGLVDFSKINTPGTYYIETEILGKSKNFEIKEEVYPNILSDAFFKLHNQRCTTCHRAPIPFENDSEKFLNAKGGWHTSFDGEKDVVTSCQAIMDICTAYEFYPKAFTDDYGYEFSENNIPDILDEAAYEIDWLYVMQNPETGGVYTSISKNETGKDNSLYVVGETTRATAYFCATMAKFSYTYKKFDSEMASKALQAANAAWKCLEANKDIVAKDQMFRAATELFRATGLDVYKRVVHSYIEENIDKPFEDRLVVGGVITYLSTARGTSVEYCTKLMSNFMEDIKQKVSVAQSSRYEICSDSDELKDYLRNAYELILVDYINTNEEFVPLEEDYLHFLCGRNEFSKNYLVGAKTPEELAKLIAVSARLSVSTVNK